MAVVVEEPVAIRRPATLLAFLTLGLVTLLLASAIIVTYIAYDRQSERVQQLESSDRKIQQDHVFIGSKFAEQSRELRVAIARATAAYRRGFVDGKKAGTLPAKLGRLDTAVSNGFKVPRTIPRGLAKQPIRVSSSATGYQVRFPGVALFASTREPLEFWTKQAWPGRKSQTWIGKRNVARLVGPLGILYAWREDGRTYAVLAFPNTDALARQLVLTLR